MRKYTHSIAIASAFFLFSSHEVIGKTKETVEQPAATSQALAEYGARLAKCAALSEFFINSSKPAEVDREFKRLRAFFSLHSIAAIGNASFEKHKQRERMEQMTLVSRIPATSLSDLKQYRDSAMKQMNSCLDLAAGPVGVRLTPKIDQIISNIKEEK